MAYGARPYGTRSYGDSASITGSAVVNKTASGARHRSGAATPLVGSATGHRTRGGSVSTYDELLAITGLRTRSGSTAPVPLYSFTAAGARIRQGMAIPAAQYVSSRLRAGSATPTLVTHLTASTARVRGGFALWTLPGIPRWRLYDPVDQTVLTFAMNPDTGGSPPGGRPLTLRPTTAGDGSTIVFQGSRVQPQGEFSGVLRDATTYQALVTWSAKPRVLRLTDDLGRGTWIVLTQFTAQRVPSRAAPERRTYTCRYQVVGQ